MIQSTHEKEAAMLQKIFVSMHHHYTVNQKQSYPVQTIISKLLSGANSTNYFTATQLSNHLTRIAKLVPEHFTVKLVSGKKFAKLCCHGVGIDKVRNLIADRLTE